MAQYTIDFQSTADLAFAEETEKTALRFVLIFATIQLIVLLVFDWARASVPLVGGANSVAGHALIGSIVISLFVSPVAYLRGIRYRNARKAAKLRLKRNRGVVPLTIGVSLLVGLIVTAGFEIVSRSFVDVSLDLTSTAMILMILAGAFAYMITKTLMLARTSRLFVGLAVFYLFATLLFSTYFQDNPLWWQKSFSYLGMSESNSKFIFNVGLIFTGILVVVWQLYFMEKFVILQHVDIITPRTYRIIYWVLMLMGILLACVGIFRFGIGTFFNILHDISATGMGVLAGLLMLTLYWLVPGYRQVFYVTSVVMVVMIAIAVLLKIAGQFNLVGLELAGFTLAGLWLLLFEHNTDLLVAQTVAKLE